MEIRPNITKWWTAAGETIPLLVNREYAMTSSFDGRALAAIKKGMPIRMVWDGASLTDNHWTILEGAGIHCICESGRNSGQLHAMDGLSRSEPKSIKYLPAELVPLLSINPHNAAKLVRYDAPWFLENRSDGKSNAEHIQERFLAWRAQ